MADARELDVVLYGATGFVGKLTAEYLATRAQDGARIGLAGRSKEKLERVRAELGAPAADWTLVVADSSDPDALAEMARRATTVATSVGPYRKYGMELVEACANAGTHYADLTGEPLFMRETIDRFDAAARETGARIVHTCGFDSIPSDIGVLLLHEAAGELDEATFVLRRVKGGISGGTLDTMKDNVDQIRGHPSLLRKVADPYLLSPDRESEPDLGRQRDMGPPERNADLGGWLGPFLMAPVNTRVVRRSNALQGWAYGRRFRYREVMAFGDGIGGRLRALAVGGGMAGMGAGLAFPPTRVVLDRLLPDPGEGPKEDTVRNGFYEVEIHARTPAGQRWVCRQKAQGDPGYGATSVLFGESALCLALDRERLPDRAGILTPATAMGTAIADRLRAAGQTLEVSQTG